MTDNDSVTTEFIEALDVVLSHGLLRNKKSVSLWDFLQKLAKICKGDEAVKHALKTCKKVGDTPQKHAMAFIRFGLSNKTIEMYIMHLTTQPKMIKAFYHPHAFFATADAVSGLNNVLMMVSSVDFDVDLLAPAPIRTQPGSTLRTPVARSRSGSTATRPAPVPTPGPAWVASPGPAEVGLPPVTVDDMADLKARGLLDKIDFMTEEVAELLEPVAAPTNFFAGTLRTPSVGSLDEFSVDPDTVDAALTLVGHTRAMSPQTPAPPGLLMSAPPCPADLDDFTADSIMAESDIASQFSNSDDEQLPYSLPDDGPDMTRHSPTPPNQVTPPSTPPQPARPQSMLHGSHTSMEALPASFSEQSLLGGSITVNEAHFGGSATPEPSYPAPLIPRKFALEKQWRMTLLLSEQPAPTLEAQGGVCPGCDAALGGKINKISLNRCQYTGFLYCSECHDGSAVAPLPWKVVNRWDWTEGAVANVVMPYIDQFWSQPLLSAGEELAALDSKVKDLAPIIQLRKTLVLMQPYIVTCPSAAEQLKLIPGGRTYLIETPRVFSMQDLFEMHRTERVGPHRGRSRLLVALIELVELYTAHITRNCPICDGRGFVCELCRSPQHIYPFMGSTVHQCPECHSVLHAQCFKEAKECPKCRRLRKRRGG